MASREAKAALAALRASREGKEKRTEQYVVKEEGKLLEEVTEEEYRSIVEQRKEQFVVGDSSLGYTDEGLESWREQDHTTPSRNKPAGRKTTPAKNASGRPSKGSENSAAVAGAEVPNAFLQGSSAQGKRAPSLDLDDLLDQFCDEIGADHAAGKVSAPPKVKKVKKEADENPNAPSAQEPQAGPKQSSLLETFRSDSSTQSAQAPILVKPEESDAEKFRTSVKHAALKTEVKDEVESAPAGLSEWMAKDDAAEALPPVVCAPSTVDSLAKVKMDDDGGLWFYLLDAVEDDKSWPPRLHLFGKVRAKGEVEAYQNCCVNVECPERSLNLLLRADPEDEDDVKDKGFQAQAEFAALCKDKYPGLKPSRMKIVMRNYAFEKSIGCEHGNLPFLKVFLNSNAPALPSDLSGQAFSHMFGANTSHLERVLISRRVMGPSWLRLAPGSFSEAAGRLSWCAVELKAGPKAIVAPKATEEKQKHAAQQPSSPPPLSVMSIAVRTVQKSTTTGHEPVLVACTYHPRTTLEATEKIGEMELRHGMQQFVAVRRSDSKPFATEAQNKLTKTGYAICNNENALFAKLLGKIQELDPDVIVGHNSYGFDLDVLVSRMHSQKINFWAKMSRLRRAKERSPRPSPQGSASLWAVRHITAGRLVVDTLLASRELLTKMPTYDLPTLAKMFLRETLAEVGVDNIAQYYESPQGISLLAQHTLHYALCSARMSLHLQVLPLTKQLTNLAGNTWTGSLQYKRAERNEFLLIHEFHKNKFVVPDKENPFQAKKRPLADVDDPDGGEIAEGGAKGPRRGKAAYSGGLVLEPKVGLYDDFVLLLDFNSLYPSVIQEYNICFTSVDRPNAEQAAQCANEQELLKQTAAPESTADDEGILPQVIRQLVESRKAVKGAMKSERDERRKQQLEIRQKALKLTANSMYGCLGFSSSRFHARPLAALITAKGREALQRTVDLVEHELQLQVVYGDTDSVFVRTNTQDYDQAMQIAQNIKRAVNKHYKKLEIEIDGVFNKLLLLKKKKYAGIKVADWAKKTFESEFKGLDLVRRDWCALSKEIGEHVLRKVMSNGDKEKIIEEVHEYLQVMSKRMDDGQIEQDQYLITKSLTKAPQDYPDAKNQAHVQVALRMMQHGMPVTQGQEIQYIVCLPTKDQDGKVSAAERARGLFELKLDKELTIDIAWYKSQQLHPPIVRLLGPVEGTDAARLAECLGLDAARFAQRAAMDAGDGQSGGTSADGMGLMAQVDIEALLDTKKRWVGFQSSLQGVTCEACNSDVSWKDLLAPDEGRNAAKGFDALFRCGCGEALGPRRAQNVLVLQLRNALQRYHEGVVQCGDSVCRKKTRRIALKGSGNTCLQPYCSGQVCEVFGAASLLHELEYMDHLCSAANGFLGEDSRGCSAAVDSMSQYVARLLRLNRCNWVDTAQLFGDVFGPAKTALYS